MYCRFIQRCYYGLEEIYGIPDENVQVILMLYSYLIYYTIFYTLSKVEMQRDTDYGPEPL